MSDFVVVDASLALKWLLEEDDSNQAQALLEYWGREDRRPSAPHLLPAEVTNALHQQVVKGELTVPGAVTLIDDLQSLVDLHSLPHLHGRALELASELRQGAAYDCHYLALAEALDCELWTAEERFHRAAIAAFPFVHALREVESPG